MKYINKILFPITNKPILFWIFFLLLLIPNYPSYVFPHKFFSWVELLPNIFVSFLNLFLIDYFICLLVYVSYKLNKRFGVIFLVFIHIIVYIVSITELSCIKLFQTQYESSLIQLIKETNIKETTAFFETYIFTIKFCLIVLLYVFIGIIEFLLSYLCNKNLRIKKIISTLIWIFIVLVFISSISFLFTIDVYNSNFESKEKRSYKEIIKSSSYQRLYKAFKESNDKDKEEISSVESHKNIIIDSCSFKTKNIVLIIGESFNRHHSSLYGYYLNTNPLLNSVKNKYVFRDVISSINITTPAFKNFLSFKSSDIDSLKWYSTPFFPALFKKAGYNVVFYSNQYNKNEKADNWSWVYSGYFLNYPIIDSTCFSYRNTDRYKYDGELINEFEKNRHKIEKDSLNLIIFHLEGQHFTYKDRYPNEYKYFTQDSINRPDLNSAQKSEIADYDNSVLYNDFVVNRIINLFSEKEAIIIYFSDHGEEVYDCRLFAGRSHYINNEPNILKNQLDIPFIIFASDKYKLNNPNIISLIENSIEKPFIIDDLPHLMLDLAGISFKYFDPQRSLINKLYISDRKRMVGLQNEYNYDEICK